MPQPLKDKGLAELQTLLNRTNRAYARGKISLETFNKLQLKISGLMELLRTIEESEDTED